MTDKITLGDKSLEGVVGTSSAWRKWKVDESDEESESSIEDNLPATTVPSITSTNTNNDNSAIAINNKKRSVALLEKQQAPDVDSLLLEVAVKKSAAFASLVSRSTLPEKKIAINEAANKYEGKVQPQRVAVEGTAYDVQTMEFPGELMQSKDSRNNIRPKANAVASAKTTEKDSLKERTKRQRLSGQSGIGEEFKTWRSEEEMKQRQQYD